jgi:adenylate cyclase
MTTSIVRNSQSTKRRLRVRIWLVLALVLGGMTSIMAVVIGGRFYLAGRASTSEVVDDLGRSMLAQLTETVEGQLRPATDQAKFLADILSNGQVDPNDNQRLQDLLLGSLAAVRQLRAVAYVGLDHRMVWAGPNENGRGHSANVVNMLHDERVSGLLEQARRNRAQFWSKPMLFDWSTGPLLIAVTPVLRGDEVIGIIGAAISARTASERLARISGPSGLVSFMLSADGRILMHGSIGQAVPPGRKWSGGNILPIRSEFPDPVLAAMQWPPPDAAAGGEREGLPAGLYIERVMLPDGMHFIIHRRLYGYGEDDWFVGYHLPEKWLDRSFSTINRAIPFALIVLAIALGLALWLGRAIAKPMSILSQAGQRLARLDFTPLEIKSSRIEEVERAVEAQRALRNGLQWLSNYIPRSLTPVLMKNGEELISRERDVVVLFTDIVGFSQIAEGRTAAKVAALLNRHFGLLGEVIDQEGGTIDKYIGDSIMAFWGAPLEQEDRAERAVRCAQRIAQRLHVDNERRARKSLKPLRIRIGIHKGPALVGNIGAPGRVNYTLIGDTVNVAQRLEQFGRDIDDGISDAVIVISGEVASALPPVLRLIDQGDQLLHGRSTATRVFQVPMT